MAIDERLLDGGRDEIIRVELLSLEGRSLGILGKALGGRIDGNLGRVVRHGGTMEIALSRDVNWDTARIKVSRGIRLETGEELLWGCGVYRALVGDEDWSATGATVTAQLLDKTSFLDELQMDRTYTLPVGYNVTQAVRELLIAANERRYVIVDSDRALAAPLSWNPGTSYLRIINDLLVDTIGYFSLHADGDGYLHAKPYQDPRERAEAFHFRNDKRSIVAPDFKLLQEPYKVPNKVIGYTRVEGDLPMLVSVATNENELSPYSYQARGGDANPGAWRTETLADVDATTQEALDEIVLRRLITATSLARGVDFFHGWLPLAINDVVGWANTRAGVDMYGTLVSWEMSLVEGDLMHSTVSEVVWL